MYKIFMRLALFQPEIPQNTGTLLRLGACLNVSIDIIEPCSFAFSDRRMKRAGMDYIDFVKYQRHSSWIDFQKQHPDSRRILLTPYTDQKFLDFKFKETDILLLGRESDGVPDNIMEEVDEKVVIPMNPECRSINVAIAASIVLTEALRQTKTFPCI